MRNITPVDDVVALSYKGRGVSSYGNEIPYSGSVPSSSGLGQYTGGRNSYERIPTSYATSTPRAPRAYLDDDVIDVKPNKGGASGVNWGDTVRNLAFGTGIGALTGGPAGAAIGFVTGIGGEIVGGLASGALTKAGVNAGLAQQAGSIANIGSQIVGGQLAYSAINSQPQTLGQQLTPGQIAVRQYNMMQGR
jgi:hypothetical protein